MTIAKKAMVSLQSGVMRRLGRVGFLSFHDNKPALKRHITALLAMVKRQF